MCVYMYVVCIICHMSYVMCVCIVCHVCMSYVMCVCVCVYVCVCVWWCRYRLAIVGGGPAGTSVLVRAVHLGVSHELCSFGAVRDDAVSE